MNEILYYLQDRLESENNKPKRKNHPKKIVHKNHGLRHEYK